MRSSLSAREAIVLCCQRFETVGLSVGMSGNISVRTDDGFLITPSATAYDKLTPSLIVEMTADGEPLGESLKPSSEWRFHRDIYRARPDIGAVVHAHPLNCTALACTQRNIPPFHYMVAAAGGRDISLAEYALFGSAELSANVVVVLAERNACLIANHGMIALGDDLSAAFNLAIEVENLAAQYCAALSIGDVHLLDKSQMDKVVERFKAYRNP